MSEKLILKNDLVISSGSYAEGSTQCERRNRKLIQSIKHNVDWISKEFMSNTMILNNFLTSH